MILLDTHVLIWLTSSPERLSPLARTAISEARQAGEELAIVDISLLELALLAKKGRVLLGMDLSGVLDSIEARFAIRSISTRACVKSIELPKSYPKDPADRIIGATAIVEGVPLITADANIRKAKAVRTIW